MRQSSSNILFFLSIALLLGQVTQAQPTGDKLLSWLGKPYHSSEVDSMINELGLQVKGKQSNTVYLYSPTQGLEVWLEDGYFSQFYLYASGNSPSGGDESFQQALPLGLDWDMKCNAKNIEKMSGHPVEIKGDKSFPYYVILLDNKLSVTVSNKGYKIAQLHCGLAIQNKRAFEQDNPPLEFDPIELTKSSSKQRPASLGGDYLLSLDGRSKANTELQYWYAQPQYQFDKGEQFYGMHFRRSMEGNGIAFEFEDSPLKAIRFTTQPIDNEKVFDGRYPVFMYHAEHPDSLLPPHEFPEQEGRFVGTKEYALEFMADRIYLFFHSPKDMEKLTKDYLKEMEQTPIDPDFKTLVMSATLDSNASTRPEFLQRLQTSLQQNQYHLTAMQWMDSSATGKQFSVRVSKDLPYEMAFLCETSDSTAIEIIDPKHDRMLYTTGGQDLVASPWGNIWTANHQFDDGGEIVIRLSAAASASKCGCLMAYYLGTLKKEKGK